MKKIFCLIFALFLPSIAFADRAIVVGSTSRCVGIEVKDSSSATGAGLAGLVYNTAGLTCYYNRSDQSPTTSTAITLADLPSATYVSGGFKEIDATNQKGRYRLCLPDAALSAGYETQVECRGATNMAEMDLSITLTGDPAAVVWAQAVAQLSANPGVGDSITVGTMLRAVYQRFFHKFTDNGTEQAGFKADGSTKVFEANVSDSAGTYTKDANKTPD